MKKTLALVLALVMIFSLAACGSSKDNSAAEPIKIGHICDLTGSEASTGKEAERSLQFAVDAIGGEIAGRPVEIVVKDSQSDPSIAADMARQLVEQDKVVAIFGPTLIGHKSAVSGYMESVGVPLIFYNPTPEGLLMNAEWTVGASGATPQMPTVMADYVYNELGYKKIYTLTKDDTGGTSYMDPFVENYKALGGEVLLQQWAPTPTPDFAPYFIKMTDSDADAIICWTSGSSAIAFWEAWHAAGLSGRLPVVALFHGAFTDYFIPAAISNTSPETAEAMLGTIAPMTYAYNIDSPENKEFVEAWQEAFDGVPPGSNLPGACYQVILLLKAAVEATEGDTTPDALIAAILAADITGPEGRTVFENSMAATKDIFIVELVKLDDGSYNYSLVKEYKDVPPSGLAAQ